MNKIEIDRLIESLSHQWGAENVELVETHISWVILTPEFAYKIKKPLLFHFLDFSSLLKRKFYCEREIELNQRLAPDIYLEVVQVCRVRKKLALDSTTGKVIDYAVKMRRLDNSRQMNLLLETDSVTRDQIVQLAAILSGFHQKNRMLDYSLDIMRVQEDFADILTVKDGIRQQFGKHSAEFLEEAVQFSFKTLRKLAPRMKERARLGFTVDGHGDLHSRNIFLLERPVIFDCLEFNEHLRKIDVLNELAFFCMDMQFYGRDDLEKEFIYKYQELYPCFLEDDDIEIFNYYKLYRANVKVKVNALKVQQCENSMQKKYRKNLVQEYFFMMGKYLSGMSFRNSGSSISTMPKAS